MVRLFSSRLFYRSFLIFAANLLASIAVLSGITYFVFVQRFVQNQYAQASINGLARIGASVEYFVKKADDIAKYYALFDDEAISYTYRPIVQGSQLYQFLRRVRNQGYIDGNIHSVYLYYRTADTVMDISMSELYSLFPGDTSAVRAERRGNFYDTGWLAAALAGGFNAQGSMLLETRPLYVIPDPDHLSVADKNLARTHPNANIITLVRAFENQTADPRGYVVTNLSEAAVSRYLRNAHADSPQTTFIITSRGIVISREDKSWLGKDVSGESYVRAILASTSPDGFLTSRVGGTRYAVVYVRSAAVPWIYISMVPYAWLTRDLAGLTRLILAVVFLIAVGAVLSLYALSRRAYSPIEKIFGKITRIVAEPPRGMAQSELQMIESLLDQLKRNYDHLGKLVFDNLYLLKYAFLNRLIAGECDAKEREEGCAEYGIRLDREGFAVVTVVIDDFDRVLKRFSLQELYLARQTIISILEKTLAERWNAAGAGGDQRHAVVLVNGVDEQEGGDLAGPLGEAIRRVRELLQLEVSAGIGGYAATPADLGRSQRESLVALQNRVRKGRGTVILFEEVRESLDGATHDLSPLVEGVAGAMRLGQKDRCLSALERMVEEIKNRGLPRAQVTGTFLELMVVVHRHLADADVDFDAVCSTSFGDVVGAIAGFETLDALHESVGAILGCICDHYGGSKKSHNAEVITRVMAYLKGHYGEMLSLDVVADALKISPPYLSRLIKLQTGVNFLEYLTSVRMAKAEEMLLGTTLPVQEIAGRVGYQTYRTFLLNFRAHTAMIPTQYRKMKSRIVNA